MMKFALGQRWISDSESDLGLGTVVGIEGRMLTLLFPASGETRLYAIAEAPLTRVQFNPGDTIKSAEGFSLVVANIEEKNQTLVYHGHRTDDGEAVSLRETFLDHFIRKIFTEKGLNNIDTFFASRSSSACCRLNASTWDTRRVYILQQIAIICCHLNHMTVAV